MCGKTPSRSSLPWLIRFCAVFLVAQSCLTLCNSVGCNPPVSIHGILQARILEWLPCCSPGVLPNPGIETSEAPSWAGRCFTTEPPGKPTMYKSPYQIDDDQGSHFKSHDRKDWVKEHDVEGVPSRKEKNTLLILTMDHCLYAENIMSHHAGKGVNPLERSMGCPTGMDGLLCTLR